MHTRHLARFSLPFTKSVVTTSPEKLAVPLTQARCYTHKPVLKLLRTMEIRHAAAVFKKAPDWSAFNRVEIADDIQQSFVHGGALCQRFDPEPAGGSQAGKMQPWTIEEFTGSEGAHKLMKLNERQERPMMLTLRSLKQDEERSNVQRRHAELLVSFEHKGRVRHHSSRQ